jgi:threonine/homoserine/homoserine lactone efflux protein
VDAKWIVAANVFALVATVTPGPNNLVLAASGLAFGFRRTLPTMLGFLLGLLLLLFAVAAGLGSLFEAVPFLHMALKVGGTGYLLALAWMLWTSASSEAAEAARPPGFLRGLAFQAVNPKGWMMTVSAVATYTLPGDGYWPSVGMLVLAFFVCGLPSVMLWTGFGGLFRDVLGDRRRAQLAGRAMAVLTALSCVLVLL